MSSVLCLCTVYVCVTSFFMTAKLRDPDTHLRAIRTRWPVIADWNRTEYKMEAERKLQRRQHDPERLSEQINKSSSQCGTLHTKIKAKTPSTWQGKPVFTP